MGENAPAAARAGPPPSRWRRGLTWLGGGVALALAAALGAAAWLLGTQSGLEAGLALARAASGGALQVEGARGRVLGRLDIDALAYRSPGLEVELKDFSLAWSPAALLERRLDIAHLTVDRVDLARTATAVETESAPLRPPASLQLPLAIELRRLAVGTFALRELPAPEPAAGKLAGDPAGDPVPAAEPAEPPGLRFSALDAAFDSDGRHHRLRALSLTLPQGAVRLALALDGAAPFAVDGAGQFDGVIEGRALAVRLGLADTLLEPRAELEARGEGVHARVELEAASFEPVPLRRLSLRVGGFDPAAFVEGAPRATLDLDAELAPPADGEGRAAEGIAGLPLGRLVGPIRVLNRRPAAADAGGIPLESLAAVLDWRRAEIALDALDLRLAGAGRIAGWVAWQAPLAARGEGDGTGAASAPPAADTGTGTDTDTDSDSDSGTGRIVAALALTGVDPRALSGAAPSARLNLDLEAAAELPAAGLPQAATLQFRIRDSVLDGRPLSGEGRLRLEGGRLPEVRLAVRLAGNSVEADGALGAAHDNLALRLDAPALGALGFGLGGRAAAEGRVGGTLDAPNGELQFFGEDLVLPGELRLAGINGSARLDAGIDGPFALALGLSGLGPAGAGDDGRPQPDWIEHARLGAEGTRARHRLELSAAAPGGAGRDDPGASVRLVLQGGIGAGPRLRWAGELAALELAGAEPTGPQPAGPAQAFTARLAAPAALELAADGVMLGAAEIDAGGRGRIRLFETAWSPARSVLRGELSGLVLAPEPPRADGRPRRNADPLTLGARWDLQVGRTLAGEARLFRESGDLSVEGEIRTRLGLERLDAVLEARGERLDLALDVRGREFGRVHGEAVVHARRSADGRWSVPPETPVRASARLDMPSIAWLGRLVRENVDTAGRIDGRFEIAGTLAAPRASGTIQGRELGFTLIDQGLILSGGEFDLDFDDDRVRLARLEFVSPNRVRPRDRRIPFERLTATPGRFTASGEIALDSGAGDFRFEADRLPLLQREDRWMLLSGRGSARSSWSSLALEAAFGADAGYLEFAESPPPSLSDDVVVLGRDEPAGRGAFAVTADVRVGLGEALYLSALGLETRLAGELRVRLQPERPLSAVGTISTVGGSYRGYGQRLVIERGTVNFQGPLDAPGLNIVALRKGLAVEAGVAVTGSARRPQVRLVSEPNVPDPEKLSWIVLGRAPDAASGADLGLLLPAASALLGGPGGGMSEELSRSLGFDSFSIGQGELTSTARVASSRVVGSGSTIAAGPSVSGQVLSLGKRLGPDLFLSFEQSLGGAATLVKLSYQLSRRVSVIVRGGTDTALDLSYGFSFR
ncbi:translocation/assembly module TamB domain-containing protein [Thauera aromatica]|uniref:translocation/assembly module TamB domain-containing protein n=1 Tax=Thauera aromatica TaxID=59405 RepID=UPI001FFD0AA7|nr:translocation/assembly module TamB domain-containing protein [Thauera aromatica]MCK2095514.1 translocation/assembly module TamB domain-containing protein [Thauera aromatica]